MARINAKDILKLGKTPGVTLSAGDDFLSRVNQTIVNFRQLIDTVKNIQGNPNPQATAQAQDTVAEIPYKQLSSGKTESKGSEGSGSMGINEFVAMIIAAGYGDTPIGKLIQEISPFTIKQLLALAQSRGVKSGKSGK